MAPDISLQMARINVETSEGRRWPSEQRGGGVMRGSSASACLVVVVLGLLGAWGLTALAQETTPLAFEVASVKSGLQVSMSRGTQVVPGRFTFTDLPLVGLIVRAYGVPRWKITNAPDWVTTEPFTVQAIFPPSTTPAQMNAMLRTLLEQRFRLSVQMETRDMDTDVLILANGDRRLGRGMHPVNIDCESKQLREGSAPGLFPPDKRPPCGAVQMSARFNPGDPTSFQALSTRRYVAVTLTDLANALSGSRGRPVLDRTELSGQFDVELDYASGGAPSATLDARAVASTPDSAPPLAVALEQQLGLKLRRERNRVEIMIVRSVERPRAEEN
jgi:uncharacterized protein (TIGR03435 family)